MARMAHLPWSCPTENHGQDGLKSKTSRYAASFNEVAHVANLNQEHFTIMLRQMGVEGLQAVEVLDIPYALALP